MEPATGTSSSSSDGISTKSLAARLADAEAAAVEARKATEVAVVVNSRICAENALLRSKMAALLAERSENERVRENDRLRQHVLVLQSELARVTAISLLSAKVVESRVTVREGRQFVEYQLQIETDRRGTLYVWHRYSTFRSLATTLHAKNPRVPDLPNTQLFGHSTAVAIQDRIALLNHFLGVACSVQDVPWAIRVDKDTVVYKHPKCPPMVEDELRTSSSSRESVTSRLLRFSKATASKQSTIDE